MWQALLVGEPDAGDGLDAAARRVGDRWTLRILDALRRGPARYGELEQALAPIAPNVLARRLRDLEADGLITATAYQRRPVRLAYELTDAGHRLAGALDLLRQWGAGRGTGGHTGLHHATCGTEVELRLWCPTCEREVTDRDAEDLHHA